MKHNSPRVAEALQGAQLCCAMAPSNVNLAALAGVNVERYAAAPAQPAIPSPVMATGMAPA